MHHANCTRPCDRRVTRRWAQFRLEFLEPRQLLSATDLASLVASPSPGGSISPDASRTPAPTGPFGPYQIRNAYGINQVPALTTPFGPIATDGLGETIAIVDANNDSTVFSDVDSFDQMYSLSASSGGTSLFAQYHAASSFLKVVSQTGSITPPATYDSGWALEESMDVEWAHAIAPGAKIVLVEANSASYSNLTAAVQYASTIANVVSMSWGGGEFSGETGYDTSTFGTSGVVYVASSGDSGVLEWPSSSPNVVAVGGTTLTASLTNGAYSSETAWSSSGGGVSRYEPLPTYQSNAFGRYATGRTTPDVAFDANPSTGVYVVSGGTLYEVGGTSVGAPQWAAIFALADEARSVINEYDLQADGLTSWGPLDYSNVPKALYDLAYTEYQSTPSTVFHDITSGSNARYRAGRGYDLVTGLGSPQANNLVQYLTTWSLPSSSGPTLPFTTASPPAPGGAVNAASGVLPIASSAITVAVPALPSAATQAVLAGVPGAGTASSGTVLAPAPMPALPAGPALPAAAALVDTAARPVQPLPQPATNAIGTRLAAPSDLVPELLPPPALQPLTPPEIDALPPRPLPGPENPAVPQALGAFWDEAIRGFVTEGDAPALRWDPAARLIEGTGDQTPSALESSLVGAAAVAVWGAWEIRSRRGRTRQRGVLKLPEN